MNVKQVICINWGMRYGPPYINRLYGMVARNITPPFTFTCFTDVREGVRPEVRMFDLPPIGVEMPVGTPGMWPKSRLWGATLGDLEGPVLYLDLDLVVTGSLDDFFTFGDPTRTILTRNQTTPLERLGQTSVFRFQVGALKPLQEEFSADPQGVANTHRYEQRFVTRRAPGGIDFFPRSWVLHFRRNCAYTFPLNYVLQPALPKDTRIVIFAGDVKPHDAIVGTYHSDRPHRTRLQHIADAFRPGRKESVIKHIRHYLLPTDWVAKHWRE